VKCPDCGTEVEEAVHDAGPGREWVKCWLEPSYEVHTDARCIAALCAALGADCQHKDEWFAARPEGPKTGGGT
jgi:hypothetical protein